ncbi:MAG: hypothetical protein PHY48_13005 [Candidatus Cloacimonetes bacterium]|nr:hypothetical protein [Candidatus Cloacimonadota bacterium]
MKRAIFTVLLMLAALGLFAHPANDVSLTYDAKTMLLTVTYEHTVKNPADHYVESVLIKINGKDVISQSLPMQESTGGGSLVYKLIGVKAGALIEATVTCNKGGKKTGKLPLK